MVTSYDATSQLLFVPTVDTASRLTATGLGEPAVGEQRLGSTFGMLAVGGMVAGVEALTSTMGGYAGSTIVRGEMTPLDWRPA